MRPARRAANVVNGFMVEPGAYAFSNATLGLTIARMRPVCGSRTMMVPSRPESALAAAADSARSISSCDLKLSLAVDRGPINEVGLRPDQTARPATATTH